MKNHVSTYGAGGIRTRERLRVARFQDQHASAAHETRRGTESVDDVNAERGCGTSGTDDLIAARATAQFRHSPHGFMHAELGIVLATLAFGFFLGLAAQAVAHAGDHEREMQCFEDAARDKLNCDRLRVIQPSDNYVDVFCVSQDEDMWQVGQTCMRDVPGGAWICSCSIPRSLRPEAK